MKMGKLITLLIAVILPLTIAWANGPHYSGKLQQALFRPGSLRANIKRVAYDYGWKQVIWTAANDYRWISYTKIKSGNLDQVLKVILADYPVQAVFYNGNHVLVIQPRILK